MLLSGDHSEAKIGDVGLGKILHSACTGTASNNVGTLTHAAPEAILGNRCDTKVRRKLLRSPSIAAAASGQAARMNVFLLALSCIASCADLSWAYT